MAMCSSLTIRLDLFIFWTYRSGQSSRLREGTAFLAHRFCETMVISHRTGIQELSSLTDRTVPLTVARPNVRVATCPRYWAKRLRRASVGSLVWICCTY